MKEVRSRLKRDFRIQSIGSYCSAIYQKLFFREHRRRRNLIDDLTEKAAYKLEYDKMREHVFAGKRDQLWNVIPASIQTPQEMQAYTERLQRNLNSRGRWVRTFSGMTLKDLRRGQDQHEPRLNLETISLGCQRHDQRGVERSMS